MRCFVLGLSVFGCFLLNRACGLWSNALTQPRQFSILQIIILIVGVSWVYMLIFGVFLLFLLIFFFFRCYSLTFSVFFGYCGCVCGCFLLIFGENNEQIQR